MSLLNHLYQQGDLSMRVYERIANRNKWGHKKDDERRTLWNDLASVFGGVFNGIAHRRSIRGQLFLRDRVKGRDNRPS